MSAYTCFTQTYYVKVLTLKQITFHPLNHINKSPGGIIQPGKQGCTFAGPGAKSPVHVNAGTCVFYE